MLTFGIAFVGFLMCAGIVADIGENIDEIKKLGKQIRDLEKEMK